jgi:hypothetical protein
MYYIIILYYIVLYYIISVSMDHSRSVAQPFRQKYWTDISMGHLEVLELVWIGPLSW